MNKMFMKTVTFIDSVVVVDDKNVITFKAAAGETMDLPAPSANRWLRRGKAVDGHGENKIKSPDKVETLDKTTEPPKKNAPKKKSGPKKQTD